MIPEIDQQTLDFDWFFTDGENIGYAASGGGKLPPSVSAKTFGEIELLFDFFRDLPETSQIEVNVELSTIIGSTADADYLRDFVFMAKRGLYSFDKTVLSDFADTRYHLVVKPLRSLKLDQLPAEIREMISMSTIRGSLDVMTINSALVS